MIRTDHFLYSLFFATGAALILGFILGRASNRLQCLTPDDELSAILRCMDANKQELPVRDQQHGGIVMRVDCLPMPSP
jgi:hypothetical protein